MTGVITSSVGYKSVLENIITLTDVKAASEFRPTPSGSQKESEKVRHADFYFEIPTSTSTTNRISPPIPLSGTFTGTNNFNQKGSLNDNPVVHGECEVSYWIEAKFRLAGRQVGFLNRHIQVSALYPRLRISLAKNAPLTIRAKPDLLARCRFQKSPEVQLTFSEPNMSVTRDCTTGKRHITLPLAATMGTTSNAFAVQSRQSLTCTVEAKWEVNVRFSTMAGRTNPDRLKATETIHKTTTASTQKSTILFRPLPQYDSKDDPRSNLSGPHITTSQLELSVPDSVSQPSLDWKFLSRSYTLNLTLHFRGIQGAPNYSLQTRLPLSVAACDSKADENVQSHITVDIPEATLDFDEEEDLNRASGAVRMGQAQPQRQGQRTVTRTPPPPYFR